MYFSRAFMTSCKTIPTTGRLPLANWSSEVSITSMSRRISVRISRLLTDSMQLRILNNILQDLGIARVHSMHNCLQRRGGSKDTAKTSSPLRAEIFFARNQSLQGFTSTYVDSSAQACLKKSESTHASAEACLTLTLWVQNEDRNDSKAWIGTHFPMQLSPGSFLTTPSLQHQIP